MDARSLGVAVMLVLGCFSFVEPAQADDAEEATDALRAWRQAATSEERRRTAERLAPQIAAGRVAFLDLVSVAQLDPDADGIRAQARRRLLAIAPESPELVAPTVAALERAGTQDRPFLQRLVRRLTGDEGHDDQVELSGPLSAAQHQALRAHVPRFLAWLQDAAQPDDRRMALLSVVHRLGPEMSSAAGALLGWIERILEERSRLRARHPHRRLALGHRGHDITAAMLHMDATAAPVVLPVLLAPSRRDHLDLPFEDPRPALAGLFRKDADALRGLVTLASPPVQAQALDHLLRDHGRAPATLTVLGPLAAHPGTTLGRTAFLHLVRHDHMDDRHILNGLAHTRSDVRQTMLLAMELRPRLLVVEVPWVVSMATRAPHAHREIAIRLLRTRATLLPRPDPSQILEWATLDRRASPHAPLEPTWIAAARNQGAHIVSWILARLESGKDPYGVAEAMLAGLAPKREDKATQALGHALGTSSRRVRILVARALLSAGHPGARPVLVRALTSAEDDLRDLALPAVASLGRDADPAFLPLLDAWRRAWEADRPGARHRIRRLEDALVRLARRKSLRMIGWLRDPGTDLPRLAWKALRGSGVPGQEAVAYVWATSDPRRRGNLLAVAAREVRAGPARAVWQAWLRERFSDPTTRPEERVRIAQALGAISPEDPRER